MFAIRPGGSGGSGGSGGASSTLRQHLWFFGKFGIYFGLLRYAFVYMSGNEAPKSLEDSK